MQTPVGEHIRKLEERLELLNMQVMENRRALAERNQIESEIRAVNLALSHYRAALELEIDISIGRDNAHRRKSFARVPLTKVSSRRTITTVWDGSRFCGRALLPLPSPSPSPPCLMDANSDLSNRATHMRQFP